MSETENLESRLATLESRLNRLELISSINVIYSKIERDLRDLYIAVGVANFSNLGEDGYVPERQVDHGWRNVMPGYKVKWYVPSKSAQQERVSALQELASISQHLEEARVSFMDRQVSMSYDRINEIGYYVNQFQGDVRHRLFEIDNCRIRFWTWSLNELSFCIRCIFIASCETVDYIDNKYRISTWEFEPVPKIK